MSAGQRWRYLWVAPLAVALASCSDSTKPSGGGCQEISSFEVGSGSTPAFSWTPSCSVTEITVRDLEDTSSSQVKWHVIADANVIRPPVTYGVAPAGATATIGPDFLIAHCYQVELYVRDPLSVNPVYRGGGQFKPTWLSCDQQQ